MMGIKCGRMVPCHSPPLERCVRFLIPLISVIVIVLAEPTRHTRRSGMGDTCRRLAQGHHNVTTLRTGVSVSLQGIVEGAQTGYSVSAAGDLNGDGVEDMVFGAWKASPSTSKLQAGQAFVVFGSATGFPERILLDDFDGINGFVISGLAANDELGYAVSKAGDVNGDGLDDVVIAAHMDSRSAPKVYVLFGSASGFPGSIDLATLDGTKGFSIENVPYQAFTTSSGLAISSAGDLNNDGLADIAIGAWEARVNDQIRTGQVYVLFGSASGFAGTIDVATDLAGGKGLIINGKAASHGLGRSVSHAGDVNGDGIADLAIGSVQAGEAYVLFGSSSYGAVVELSVLDGTNGFTIHRFPIIGNLDLAVGRVGDVNGDGTDDVVVGAYQQSKVYVLFGSTAGFPSEYDVTTLDGTNGFTIQGSQGMGLSVSGGGDMNGDNVADIVIGSDSEEGGKVHVIYGSVLAFEKTIDASTLDGSNGYEVNGFAAGKHVVDSGDFNDDGLRDLLFGSPRSDVDGHTDAGGVYVLYGLKACFPWSEALGEVSMPNSEAASQLALSGAGDVNGDGIGDFVVGAWEAGGVGEEKKGKVFVVFGTELDGDGTDLDVTNLNGTNGFVLHGIMAGDEAGRVVASAGDINGDGYDDVLVAAYNADPGSVRDAGQVYVIFGSASRFQSEIQLASLNGTAGFILNGALEDGSLGFAMSSAGDVNGDGISDLILSAYKANTQKGRTYVIFGTRAGFTSPMSVSSLDGTIGFAMDGVSSYDNAGISVSSVGDVNGDGIGDIVLGAWYVKVRGRSKVGQAYVVFGSRARFPSVLQLSSLNGTSGFTINGIGSNDQTGKSVSSAGDLNHDGIDDIVIGAWLSRPGDIVNGGQVFVIFGTASGFDAVFELSSLDGSNGFVLQGANEDDAAGMSVSHPGDVNGDGISDLFIGGYFASVGETIGKVYVLFGSEAEFPRAISLSSLNGRNGFLFSGVTADEWQRLAGGPVGDINGDGMGDMMFVAGKGRLVCVRGKRSGECGCAPLSAYDCDTPSPVSAYGFHTACPGLSYGQCTQYLDECESGPNACDPAVSECRNTLGSFVCECLDGWDDEGVVGGGCFNVDECLQGTHNCNPNAACSDARGSFSCSCNSGYSGNGVSCDNVNECTSLTANRHTCHEEATCTDSTGSFSCVCNAGYGGNGAVCVQQVQCEQCEVEVVFTAFMDMTPEEFESRREDYIRLVAETAEVQTSAVSIGEVQGVAGNVQVQTSVVVESNRSSAVSVGLTEDLTAKFDQQNMGLFAVDNVQVHSRVAAGPDESTPISAAVRERGGGRGGWETPRVGEWGLALALCIAATFA